MMNPPILVVFFLVAMTCPAQEHQPARSDPEKDFILSMNVDLVLLHATVKGRGESFSAGLSKENFQVLEDGRPQELKFAQRADIPVTLGLVMDQSGSMIPRRAEVIAAALALVEASNPQDEVFVVNFNESVSLPLPPERPFTANVDELRAVLSAPPPSGQTALYDAIALALEQIRTGRTSKRVLVVLSDGGDNASRHTFEQVLDLARKSNVIIYALGIYDEADQDRRPGVLKRLAKESGGEAFIPNSLDRVRGICRGIARDIRNQYVLGYIPLDISRNGDWRTLRVKARAPDGRKLSVRTRTGYFASEGKP